MSKELTVEEMARELGKQLDGECPKAVKECPDDCGSQLPYEGCVKCWQQYAKPSEIRAAYEKMKATEAEDSK